jgi:hypothetical protein
MGAPDQLTRSQEDALQLTSNGAPLEQLVVKHAGGLFAKSFPLRENDVVLVTINKL